jgi:ribosomal protein S18 acetylase RimI-like enzyme
VIALLTGHGYRVIRSIFAWPEPETFMEAAPAAGFIRLDRMDMVRKNAGNQAIQSRPNGIGIAPWSQEYFEDVARIMFDNYYPGGRIANPLANTIEECRTHLHNIVTGSHGELAKGRSFVALCEGRPAGYLLISTQPGDGGLVVELAVDRRFRGGGIASAMTPYFICIP